MMLSPHVEFLYFIFLSELNMDGWKAFGITVIVLLVWYLVCMILSIILGKVGASKNDNKLMTAARVLKGLSIFNYPFKKLDELTLHVEHDQKLRNVALNKTFDKLRQMAENKPTQKGGFGWYADDYIEERPDF